ncbi:hypothetical protein QFC19_001785 [Naganishia cerealis]|uniref:Uncharacterized protein n=1 Tax=Naganishia cerealis TaxID=610337 RepID=A0ACC2WG18_9TREE|nr:hypothetical protein QFC19_001785 [Naganishia cerealis]
MAMFGERSSESPRLPSPWQQALASPSPAISIISQSDIDFETSSPGSRSNAHRRRPSESSIALRTPSQLSLSTNNDDLVDLADFDSSPSPTSTSAFQRLCSSGVSENLILHSAPGYAASASTSTSASVDAQEHARPGVSGGLAGFGYEGIKLIAERDKIGHIEYKLRLLPSGPERFERLTTQLKWRLQEGGGQAVYEIGVLDDGTLIGITNQDMDRSLETLELMAAELGATVMVLRAITLANPPPFPKALMADDGGESGDECQHEQSEALADCFGPEACTHREIKKKKSPKQSKNKKKSSTYRTFDNQQSSELLDTARTACFTSSSDIHLSEPVSMERRHVSMPDDYDEHAGRKCEAKMARRRLSSGYSPHELSAKQRKAWGASRKGDSIWDGYGDSDADPFDVNCGEYPLKNDWEGRGVRINAEDLCEVPSSPPPARESSPPYAAAVAESWRARNMARALQQDNTRWHRKSVLSPEERDVVRQARKSRKALRNGDRQRDFEAEQEGFGFFCGSDHSRDRASEKASNREGEASYPDGLQKESDVDDAGFELFNFDTSSQSESEGDPLTREALAALDTTTALQSTFPERSYKKGFHRHVGLAEDASAPDIDVFASTKRKKLPKKRRVRVQRAEERRLDLLRGDGTAPNGIPLFFDTESGAMGMTGMMEASLRGALSDHEEDDADIISSVVRRLVGETEEEDSQFIRRGAKLVEDKVDTDICAILSTSPSYTIKPTSPSAHHLFSLPIPLGQPAGPSSNQASIQELSSESVPSLPSPSNTITMPLDNLSLSFSHCELCTTISRAPSSGSSENGKYTSIDAISHGDGKETAAERHGSNINEINTKELDLSDARLCVEALIVKKMDMDERYLDFSGFIL